MNPLTTSHLPGYWYAGRQARREMRYRSRRIYYGPVRRRQYVLLVEPEDVSPEEERPWGIYFHGGAWTFGYPEAFVQAVHPWLEQGYRVAMPSYRRPPRAWLPDIVKDCRAALEAIAREDLPLNQPRLSGMSAGGQLAALFAHHPEWWSQAGWSTRGPARVLLCASPLDLRLLQPRFLFKRWEDFNPTTRPAVTDVEWLIVQGTNDQLIDNAHAQRFHGKYPATSQVLWLAEGSHLDAGTWAFDDQHPYYQEVTEFLTGR